MFFICFAVAGFVIFRTSILFFSRSTWSICCFVMGFSACFLLPRSVGWIIFHCNSNCTELLRVFYGRVMAANHLRIVRNCCSNIYFSYCFGGKAIVRCVCLYFCVPSDADESFPGFALCCFFTIRECTFFAFRAGFSIDSVLTDSLCVFFCFRLLDANGPWKLIFHYKIFMKWVCLHPSMGL